MLCLKYLESAFQYIRNFMRQNEQYSNIVEITQTRIFNSNKRKIVFILLPLKEKKYISMWNVTQFFFENHPITRTVIDNDLLLPYLLYEYYWRSLKVVYFFFFFFWYINQGQFKKKICNAKLIIKTISPWILWLYQVRNTLIK